MATHGFFLGIKQMVRFDDNVEDRSVVPLRCTNQGRATREPSPPYADVLVDPDERRICWRQPAPLPEQAPPRPKAPAPYQEYVPEAERRFPAWLEGTR